MRILSILIAIVVIFTFSVPSQSTQEKPMQIPAGWRLPTQNDLKEQWSEKYWNDECKKGKESLKKSASDAIEEIGDIPRGNTTEEPVVENEGCWKPDFPVHMASGDYNGDGIQDEARILLSTTKRKTIGIYAFLKSKGARVSVVRIITITDANPQSHFIATEKPGEKIETACGKGYWDCGVTEPKSISLRRDGINFGLFESWNSIAYWDSRQNKFKVVAISD